MTGLLRGLRWRAGWAVVGLVLVLLWWGASGGPRPVLQIDFAWAPDLARGGEVMIDGEVAGPLELRSGQPRTGFRVPVGEHVVVVRTPECAGRPERVDIGRGERLTVLIADLEEGSIGGRFRCRIHLRH